MREITKSDIKNYQDYLNVGELKDFIKKHNIPDNSRVLVQRIEDVYYEKHNWGVHLKEGENAFKDDKGDLVKESLEQYHPAWSCVKYKDEDNILFIDLHY